MRPQARPAGDPVTGPRPRGRSMTDTAVHGRPSAPPAPEASSGRGAGALGRPDPGAAGPRRPPAPGLLTALALAIAAAVSGRPPREVALVLATVLVGQAVLGWDNDLVDEHGRPRRRAHRQAARHRAARPRHGRLRAGLRRAAAGAARALQRDHGRPAPTCCRSGVGLAGNRWLRGGPLSWLPWAVSFALYPAYLSYGGWGGGAHGRPADRRDDRWSPPCSVSASTS